MACVIDLDKLLLALNVLFFGDGIKKQRRWNNNNNFFIRRSRSCYTCSTSSRTLNDVSSHKNTQKYQLMFWQMHVVNNINLVWLNSVIVLHYTEFWDGKQHPKMEYLSLFTHPHVISNPFGFLSSLWNTEGDILRNVGNQTPLASIDFHCGDANPPQTPPEKIFKIPSFTFYRKNKQSFTFWMWVNKWFENLHFWAYLLLLG